MDLSRHQNTGEQGGGGVGGRGIHLSADTSGIHLRPRIAYITPVESRQEYLTTGKEYIEPPKTW